jgi:dGTPase
MTDRYDRFHHPVEETLQDQRSPGRRDRDRILYSSAFRRLAGITQVISASDRFPAHNRLTHTLEVAQIGRSLAEKLIREIGDAELINLVDPDVVEAACLAHELGHPPFGHVAEEELDRLVTTERGFSQGFEGNAQSFRVVTKLAVRRSDPIGLNLTRATLNAILKYPWLRDTPGIASHKKWGAYDSERPEFEFAHVRAEHRNGATRCLEAEIMDWADDVAYAVHDVEDFYRAGIVPLDRLAQSPEVRLAFVEAAIERDDKLKGYDPNDLSRIFNRIVGHSPFIGPYDGSRQSRATLKTFSSSLIDRYIRATSLEFDSTNAATLQLHPVREMEVSILKGLTWHYVIESRALITQRYGQKHLVNSLFLTLCDAASSEKDRRIFPEFFREQLEPSPDDDLITRTVADLISSMTESQVIDMHHRLTGISLGAALDPIVT